ncbi:MAG: hypothetical protein RLZZ453_835 [Chlamydiota bacterium]|jgi:uncharacterized protein YbcC (UPF0753/DUF2309 family)
MNTILETSQKNLDIKSRILKAARAISPVFPLKTAVACNPLLHLEDLPFWDAVEASYNQLTLDSDDTTRFVNCQLMKWLESYLGQEIAILKIPGRCKGFYSMWKELAQFDSAFIRSQDDKLLFALLPYTPLAAIEFVLKHFEFNEEEIDLFLSEQISQLPGWAGYIRFCSEWSLQSIDLVEFLAVRLGLYLIASPKKQKSLRKRKEKKLKWDRRLIEEKESAFAKELVQKIIDTVPVKRTQTKAQWVFCIDVRSEPFRKELETVGDYQTFGFAGFFGLPISVVSQECSVCCPVLLKPKWAVKESKDNHTLFEKIKSWGCQAYFELKYHFGSPFALAETIGAFSGVAMGIKSLKPYLAKKSVSTLSKHIDWKSAIPLADQIDVALSALSMMGFMEFAPIVILCGHGSTTQNNPSASSLDCGACGGNHGGVNAHILASILNCPEVRKEIGQRGIIIPRATVFIGAQHDTTTDEIVFFDDHPLLSEIKQDVEIAGRNNRLKRSSTLGKTILDKEPLRRSLDWSEVRPEWGLAKNGAFIVGPRELSSSLDLQARAFLHSYNFELDKEGSLLETILTAPMVVAEWINTQYFFSTIDPQLYGSGSKITQNVVGKFGVMQGNRSDLMHGLALQSVFITDQQAYHEPLRLLTIVFAPRASVKSIIEKQPVLQRLFYNQWVHLVVIEPGSFIPFELDERHEWREYRV